MQFPWNEIGGGFVARGFVVGDRRIPVGAELSAAEIAGFVNAKTLIRSGFIKPYPPATKAADGAVTRHVVHNGGGRFDVIAGVKLNIAALTKDEAEDLASRPN